jgi:hypothetical protein
MMTGSKVRLTNVHSLTLTINHNNIGMKMKNIQRQVKPKRNQLLNSYCFLDSLMSLFQNYALAFSHV